MRAGKASEDSRGHRPVSGGATTDVGHASGVDGLIAARVGLADQLRASGRAGPAVSAVFGIVPRHAFLPAIMAIMRGQLGLANGQRVLEIGTGTGYNAALIAEIIGDPNAVGGLRPDPILWSELWAATCGCCRLGWRKWSQLKNTGRQGR